jgi:diguanylate cyclase (GGDEF)-like protein
VGFAAPHTKNKRNAMPTPRPLDAPGSRAAGRPPSSLAIAWLTAIAFIIFLAGSLLHSRMTIERQLRDEADAVARLAAEYLTAKLDVSNHELLAVEKEIHEDLLSLSSGRLSDARLAKVKTVLARAIEHHPNIVSLTVADATGQVLHDASRASGVRPLGDSWVSSTLASTYPGTSVSGMIEGRNGDSGYILMARRIEGANDRTAGALLARIEIREGFAQLQRSAAIGDGDFLLLHDANDVVLASEPSMPASHPKGMGSGLAINDAQASEKMDGANHAQPTADGNDHLTANRKVDHYPLRVTYGRDAKIPLTTWRHQALAAMLASLLALIATAIITQGIRRRVQLARQLDKMRVHLEETNLALRDALGATELLAAKDQLTGLWNRRSFDQRLQESIAHFARHPGAFSLLLIDIDHFKRINDCHGHFVGDEVLKWFADILDARLRQNDVAARWGGEEFAVLVDGANLDNAILLAEQIRTAVADDRFGKLDRITISIGVAEYEPGETDDNVLVRADRALYEAKRNGRNRVIGAHRQATPVGAMQVV